MNIQLNDNSLFKSQAYIDGHWVDGDSGSTLEVLANVASVGVTKTKRAIAAAQV
ncbi:hypothetical protein [Sessilibacter corallicola]|uniref:Aldehyde dehydrogenase family protein n=1 Tax=Sessilibacter corallicola TaxID=2904075 RepID=A0ABQ0ADF4_9GAMM